MYRVLVVDDQELFRSVAITMLTGSQHFEVAGQAPDGGDAVQMFEELLPDLVLMDVQMPAMNGFEATRRIIEAYPQAAVVLTSMRMDLQYARMAQEVGARGFIPKRDLDAAAVLRLLEPRPENLRDEAA